MTLIVTAGNANYAVIAADTRLSWDGKLVDDASAKVANLQFCDGKLISAYTGLARWGSFETRKWLHQTLQRVAQLWKKTDEVLSLLRAELTREFKSNSEIAALSAHQRKLTLVFSGFIDNEFVAALISNFQGKDGLFPEVVDDFMLTRFRATDASGSWCAFFGALSTVPQHDLEQLNQLIILHKDDPLPVKGKCHAMVLRAGPNSGGTVGPNILTATLPRGGHVSSWYSTEGATDTLITPDNFHALAGNGGYPMAIHNVEISIPGQTSQRPKRRGKRGKHQP
jgi:hypothetical protein